MSITPGWSRTRASSRRSAATLASSFTEESTSMRLFKRLKRGRNKECSICGHRKSQAAFPSVCPPPPSSGPPPQLSNREFKLKNGGYASICLSCVEHLANILKNEASIKGGRESAARALGTSGDKGAIQHLFAALTDSDPDIQIAAYEGLIELGEYERAWRHWLDLIRSRSHHEHNCSHHKLYIISNGEYCVGCGKCFRVS